MPYLEKCVVTYFEVFGVGVNYVSRSRIDTLVLSAIYWLWGTCSWGIYTKCHYFGNNNVIVI